MGDADLRPEASPSAVEPLHVWKRLPSARLTPASAPSVGVGPASILVGNLVAGKRIAQAAGRDLGLIEDQDLVRKVRRAASLSHQEQPCVCLLLSQLAKTFCLLVYVLFKMSVILSLSLSIGVVQHCLCGVIVESLWSQRGVTMNQ